ncbi:Uncharacterised protein [Klebsiella variicola]|nr:Uncharacterised protein [Klebsiella variicola]SLX01856.1 Uncharacterised protein [Klebsiella variicola]SLX07223.1 Uncharacterised protein [Klebsiella variicola]
MVSGTKKQQEDKKLILNGTPYRIRTLYIDDCSICNFLYFIFIQAPKSAPDAM